MGIEKILVLEIILCILALAAMHLIVHFIYANAFHINVIVNYIDQLDCCYTYLLEKGNKHKISKAAVGYFFIDYYCNRYIYYI